MFFFLRSVTKYFCRNQYKPLVEVLIYKENLLHNFREFQRESNLAVAPVLKSNAYGYGLVQVADILSTGLSESQIDAPFFVVDSYHEALILRKNGIETKILIIGFTFLENIERNKLKNVIFTLSNSNQIKEFVEKINYPNVFHLKIDTEMHRQGVSMKELKPAFDLIKKNKNIVLEGICSHLADADNIDDQGATLGQIKNWNLAIEIAKNNFPEMKYFHLSATSGVRYSGKINANVMRLGLGLYGINAVSSFLSLKPVLEMKSIISGIKEIEKGEKVGYNFTYCADEKIKIATVPVGYFEGVDRRLSSKGFLKIGEKFCPIVGRVSMNITIIDVSEISNLNIGDEVLVISQNSEDKNSVENIAKLCGTIPYEILVHVSSNLRRRIV